jgi:hypothetical protein
VINRRFDWNYLLRLAVGDRWISKSRNRKWRIELKRMDWMRSETWLTLRLKRWCEWVRMWMKERTRCMLRVLDLASWFGNWNEIWTLNNERTHTERVSSSFFVRDRSQFSTEQNTHSCIAWHFWVNLLIKLN